MKLHSDLTRMNANTIEGAAKTMLNIQINSGDTEGQKSVLAFPLPDVEADARLEVIDVIDEDEG